MTPPLVMILAMGAMYAAGIYLMLDRSLTRVLLGFLLMGNATNLLLLLTGGLPGRPPLTDGEDFSTEGMLDPLPQALILTAIVIGFGLLVFSAVLVYRNFEEMNTMDPDSIRVAEPLGDTEKEPGDVRVEQPRTTGEEVRS